MSKKLNKEEIQRELEAVDREIASLEAAKLAEERAHLVESLQVVQDNVMKAYDPFEEAVCGLRGIWAEIESIHQEHRQLRNEIEGARDAGRASDEAPGELSSLQVPEDLTKVLKEVNAFGAYGSDQGVCGRRYLFSRIRRGILNGLTTQQQAALL